MVEPARTPESPDRVRHSAPAPDTGNATRHGWGGRGDHASGEVLRVTRTGVLTSIQNRTRGETLALKGRGTGTERDVPQPGTQ